MTDKNAAANEKALGAGASTEALNRFLTEEKDHILRLTGRILGRNITESDDEYSIALTAVSEAVKNYDGTRGDFWSYAAFVIKSRETDHYRKESKRNKRELPLSPTMFDGDTADDESDYALKSDINEKTAVCIDNSVKEEIEALSGKLKEYGISFFDLADCSPKAGKSKDACGKAIKAIFTPPPLIEEIIKSKTLPIKQILSRVNLSRKLIDRHRKYLISVSLILSGDYPQIAEYIPFRNEIKTCSATDSGNAITPDGAADSGNAITPDGATDSGNGDR